MIVFSSALYADDGFVVIVNKDVNVDELTVHQVMNIYMSNTDMLPGGADIIPLDQFKGTEARYVFYSKIINMPEHQVKTHFSKLIFSGKGRPPISLADDQAILKQVSNCQDFIAYVRASSVNDSVKVVLTFK